MVLRSCIREGSTTQNDIMRLLLLGLAALSLVGTVNGLAVMSVDMGTEWMKVAVVSPGVPMEIVLNAESKRKSAAAVAIRDGERNFGSDALAVGVRHPKSCYAYLIDLIGKPFDHLSVALYRQRFPYYDMEADPDRGTVVFRHDSNTTYTPEELIAMILSHAKGMAEAYTDQKPIRDAVITVPVYFNQAERRSIMRAADLAGLNTLQLISEPMAVALNYGMFRRKEVNTTAKHIMFYDMGAYDTTVTIVSFQLVKTKERGFSETHPQAQIMGVGYDRTLGGLELQIRLREHLADKFNELKKPKTDVRKNPRAMAKLLKEAGRVKNVLSANTAIFAQVENVMDDIDFKLEISRDNFLSMNEDYFKRAVGPAEKAIAASGMTIGEVDEVILVGAGTRVPRVQELLNDFIGADKELGKNLNTDEAAAMGAVYKAADLSTGFKVKKFLTKEAVVLPVEVEFEREYEDAAGQPAVKVVKRNVFPPMNAFPQKKVMTFNKFADDFVFRVQHNELEHLGADELANVGSDKLAEVTVRGLAAALEKHRGDDNTESKGVKAHFNLDESGVLQVTGVEAIFEKTITVEEQEKAEAERIAKENEKKAAEGDGEGEGSWAKLGDTISSFFGDEEKKEGEKADGDEAKDGDKSDKKDEDEKKRKKKKEEEKKKKEEEETKKKKKEFKPKVETIKEELEFERTVLDFKDLTEDQFAASMDKLVALDEHDRVKAEIAQALNSLETEVIDTRDKLYQELFEKCSTEEERDAILAKCSELSDWIDEEATFDTPADTLRDKLAELTEKTAPLYARVREHTDRPEILGALNSSINTTEHFVAKALNSTAVIDGYFTQEDLDSLVKKVEEIIEWRDKSLKELEEQPMHEMPKMTTSVIAGKALELDTEVKLMLNKVRIGKAARDRKMAKEEKEKEKERKKKEKEEKKNKTDADETTEAGEEEKSEQTEGTLKSEEEVPVAESPEKDVPDVESAAEETPKEDDEGNGSEHVEL